MISVYYRITSIPSTNPSPLYQQDKGRLNVVCLGSFIRAYYDLKPRVTFLCDFCPREYREMIRTLVPAEWPTPDIFFSEMGINTTCLAQYDLYKKSEDDCVLFQECDYYHVAPLTETMIRALQLVSPYDHPDKYELGEVSKICTVDNHHFKTTVSTTATFATTRETFSKFNDTFYKFGYLDHQRWVEVGEQGGVLYSPIPALATHMVSQHLSPSISWSSLFTQ